MNSCAARMRLDELASGVQGLESHTHTPSLLGEEHYSVAEGGNLESTQLEELRNVDRSVS